MGAGGSLVVAGLICLIAASAMLAFRSWPGTDAGRPQGRLSLRTPAEKASGRAAPGPLPPSATTAGADTNAGGGATTRTRGDAPGRSDRPRDRGPVATAPQPPANTTPPAAGAQPVPVTTTPPADQGGEGSGSDGGSGSGGGGGGGGTTPAAGPVQQVVGTGRQAVNSLTASLPVPPEVRQPVDEALDTTENVARTADGVVGQVPVAGETVGDVTGTLSP